MDIFFGNLFWGVLLILIGASIILKGLNINFPIVKTFIAIIIILFGIKILIGTHSSKRNKNDRHHSVIYSSNASEYTTIFSSNVTDLSDLDDSAKDMDITVVFGSSLVRLPNNIDFDIEPTAVFGTVNLPARKNTSKQHDANSPSRKVVIDATAVFGRLDFVFVEPAIPDSASATKDSTPLREDTDF